MTKLAEVVNKPSPRKMDVVQNRKDAGKSLPSSKNAQLLANKDSDNTDTSEVAQKKSSPYWSHQSNSAEGKSNGQAPAQRAAAEPNKTGLPDNVKAGAEHLSGMSLSDVNVHYNSDKPAQLAAHAYAQGTDIHVAPGQEKHVAHEAWHVVQQKQGRVNATTQMKTTTPVNDDAGLESEADRMGAKAATIGSAIQAKAQLKKNELNNNNQPAQKVDAAAEPVPAEESKVESETVVGDDENNLTLNDEGGSISIMGYQVAIKSAKGSKEVEVSMPEMSMPEDGNWGAMIEIPIPIDPTGLAAINVGIGVSGALKVKPSFKAIREKTKTSTIYKLSGNANVSGEIMVDARAGVSVGSALIAKAQAGVFAKGGIELKDSSISLTGIYEKMLNGAAGNVQGDLDVNIKGALVASVGGFLEASALMGMYKKTKTYTLGKWNLGEVDKKWKSSISSVGFGMPSFKDLYKPTKEAPEIKAVEEKEEPKA